MCHEYRARLIEEGCVLEHYTLFAVDTVFSFCGKSSTEEKKVQFFHFMQICDEYH